MGADHNHDDELLTPLEQHIVELIEELSAAIGALGGDDDELFPLAEFDQRLLLEHAQTIQRYVLAQAAARAYPGRYRLIGSASPRAESGNPDRDHADHEHDDTTHRHYVADPAAAREAHRQGRAVIGEHPWEHEHDHDDEHSHADEWEWETLAQEPPTT
jgi:hypothetical protein